MIGYPSFNLIRETASTVDIMTLRNEISEMLKTATSYGIDHEHGQATVQAMNAQNQILIAALEEIQGFRADKDAVRGRVR